MTPTDLRFEQESITCFQLDDGTVVDMLSQTVRCDGIDTKLRTKSLMVFSLLLQNPGRTIPQQAFLSLVWSNTHVVDNVINRSIQEIRAVLKDNALNPRLVETVPRKGFRFIGHVDKTVHARPVPIIAENDEASQIKVPASSHNQRIAMGAMLVIVAVIVAAVVGNLTRDDPKPGPEALFIQRFFQELQPLLGEEAINRADFYDKSFIALAFLRPYPNAYCTTARALVTALLKDTRTNASILSMNRVVNVCRAQLSPGDPVVVALMQMQGELQIRHGNFADGVQTFRTIVQQLEKGGSGNREDVMRYSFYLSKALLKCVYPQCERLSALAEGKEMITGVIQYMEDGKRTEETMYLQSLELLNFFTLDDFPGKLRLSEKVYYAYERLYGSEDAGTLRALRSWAKQEQFFGRMEQAVVLFDKARVVHDGNTDIDKVERSLFLYDYAVLLMDTGQLDEAEPVIAALLDLGSSGLSPGRQLLRVRHWLYSGECALAWKSVTSIVQDLDPATSNFSMVGHGWRLFWQVQNTCPQYKQPIATWRHDYDKLSNIGLAASHMDQVMLMEHEYWFRLLDEGDSDFESDKFVDNWARIKRMLASGYRPLSTYADHQFMIKRLKQHCVGSSIVLCEHLEEISEHDPESVQAAYSHQKNS